MREGTKFKVEIEMNNDLKPIVLSHRADNNINNKVNLNATFNNKSRQLQNVYDTPHLSLESLKEFSHNQLHIKGSSTKTPSMRVDNKYSKSLKL